MSDDDINARITRDTERTDPRSGIGERARRGLRPSVVAYFINLAILIVAFVWGIVDAEGFQAIGGWTTTIIVVAVITIPTVVWSTLRTTVRSKR